MNLTQLPTEILGQIFNYLDTEEDLRSLHLSSYILNDLAAASLFEVIYIAPNLERLQAAVGILTLPCIARNVRELNIDLSAFFPMSEHNAWQIFEASGQFVVPPNEPKGSKFIEWTRQFTSYLGRLLHACKTTLRSITIVGFEDPSDKYPFERDLESEIGGCIGSLLSTAIPARLKSVRFDFAQVDAIASLVAHNSAVFAENMRDGEVMIINTDREDWYFHSLSEGTMSWISSLQNLRRLRVQPTSRGRPCAHMPAEPFAPTIHLTWLLLQGIYITGPLSSSLERLSSLRTIVLINLELEEIEDSLAKVFTTCLNFQHVEDIFITNLYYYNKNLHGGFLGFCSEFEADRMEYINLRQAVRRLKQNGKIEKGREEWGFCSQCFGHDYDNLDHFVSV